MLKDYIEIKNAVPTDALPLAYVGRITFIESWSHQYTAEDMKLYTEEEFDQNKLEKDLHDKVNTFFLAFMNGKVAGYAKLRRDRDREELNGAGAIEIERIYALKEFQHKKIGYLLMTRCIEAAVAEKFEWMWLGVNERNEKAIRFYKQFGFEVFGKKSFKLGNEIDEDLVMKRRLM